MMIEWSSERASDGATFCPCTHRSPIPLRKKKNLIILFYSCSSSKKMRQITFESETFMIDTSKCFIRAPNPNALNDKYLRQWKE